MIKHPGSVLEKKLTGGLGLFFGSEIFYIIIFWVWKDRSYLFGSEDFSLIFWGVAILIQFFLGVRANELHKLHKGLFFGFVIFMNLFFWV